MANRPAPHAHPTARDMISLWGSRRGAKAVLDSIFSVWHHTARMSASENQFSPTRAASELVARQKSKFLSVNQED
jgi:hypothetical protein